MCYYYYYIYYNNTTTYLHSYIHLLLSVLGEGKMIVVDARNVAV